MIGRDTSCSSSLSNFPNSDRPQRNEDKARALCRIRPYELPACSISIVKGLKLHKKTIIVSEG